MSNKTLEPGTQILLPATLAQKQLFALAQMHQQGQCAYNEYIFIELTGPFDRAAMREALIGLIHNRDCLRTTFDAKGEQQIIHSKSKVNAAYIPLKSFTDDAEHSSIVRSAIEPIIKQWMDKEVASEFDLVNGPLHRFCIAQVNEQCHILVMIYHHIITDGISMALCLYEAAERYSAMVEERPVNLEPAVSFASYVQWWEDYRKSEQCQIDKSYWLNQYNTPIEPLNLSRKTSRSLNPSFKGNTEYLNVDVTLIEQLKTLGRQQHCTLVMVFYACYTAFLSRVSGQQDFVVAIPSHGRKFERSEYVAGYCASMMPIYNKFEQTQTFIEYLAQVKFRFLEIAEYNAYPFAHILEDLTDSGKVDRGSFAKVTFNLDKLGEELCFSGLKTDLPLINKAYTAFDLYFNIVQESDSYQFQLNYSTDLFDQDDINRFAANFNVFLNALVAAPTSKIDDLDVLSEQERQLVLVEWNNTNKAYPQDKCLHELFETQVDKTPNNIAVTYENKSLSYQQLNEKSNQLAHYLVEQGIKANSLVGLCIERSVEMIVGILGIMKSGGAYVPMDPAAPILRLQQLLDDSGVKIVITQSSLLAYIPINQQLPVCLDEQNPQMLWDTYENTNLKTDEVGLSAIHLAYVIYTSGSTGKPKGVTICHQSLVNLGENLYRAVSQSSKQQSECWAWNAPYTFDASLQAITQLAYGTKIIIIPDIVRKDTEKLKQFFIQNNATIFDCTPIQIKLLLELGNNELLPTLFIGGDRIGQKTWNALVQLHESKGVRSFNAYGPTETCVDATLCSITKETPMESIGRALDNVKTYVVSRGKLVPIGSIGELLIGGVGLARAYLNRPELTQEKFIVNPFGSDPYDHLYRTGDLVRWLPNGNIEYIGRTDFQTKIRGFRIELGEIQEQLLTNELVQECVVITREERAGEKYLAAYFLLTERAKNTEKDKLPALLKDHLRRSLPDYMTPSSFVVLDHFPLNSSNKIDLKALPEPDDTAFIRQTFKGASNNIEAQLVIICQKLFGLDRISVLDNFFDIGGTSIKLLSFKNRVQEELDINIPLVDFYTYPSILTLCQSLNMNESDDISLSEEFKSLDAFSKDTDKNQGIAVISMAFHGPGASNIEALHELLKSGKEGLTSFTREELLQAGGSEEELDNPNYIKTNGYFAGKELYDAKLLGYTPREASILDPQIYHFQECIWQAAERAGICSEFYTGRVGIYGGTGSNFAWLSKCLNPEGTNAATYNNHIVASSEFLCSRTAYKFNFKGPVFSVQTACSTSLVAIHVACQGLTNRECDFAFAGGVTITPFNKRGFLHEEGMILSSTEHCRPFDAKGDGIIDGEGVALLGLKRLSDALNDCDEILAVVKGSAINNDGNQKVGFTAPSVGGQARAIYEARQRAGVESETIGYMEAHGTATKVGDPIEVQALTRAFGTEQKQFCCIGSIKSNLGHLDAAAGAAGAIKAILSLKNREFYPSLNYEEPNPLIDFNNTPFKVCTQTLPWESEGPRRAAVSSFGIGGTNAHMILEEACFDRKTSASRNIHMLLFSANSETALVQIVEEQLQYLDQHPDVCFADICYTRQVGRKPLPYRRAIAAANLGEALQALSMPESQTRYNKVHSAVASNDNSVAFLFSGQGSQYINMGKGLYETERVFRRWMDKGFEIAQKRAGKNLKAILFPSDLSDTRINETENTQPLLFLFEYALARQLMYWGITPSIMLGHSVGEYVAACLAKVFTLEDAIVLLIKRGTLIQRLAPGDMLGVLSDQASLELLLLEANQDKATISIAAINSPKSLVVSGDKNAISKLKTALDETDILNKPLHTSHAFHSHHLDNIMEDFQAAVTAIILSPPQLPYISNVTGKLITAEEATNPSYWVKHLRGCVLFSNGVETLMEQTSLTLLEVGPGQVLSTFVQQNPTKTKEHHCIPLIPNASERSDAYATNNGDILDQRALSNGMGKLFTLGTNLNWKTYYEDEIRGIIKDLPTYPFERKAYWKPGAVNAFSAASSIDLFKPQAMENWFSIPTWKPASLPPPLHLEEGQSWLIFMDNYGIGEQLIQRLSDLGKHAICVLAGDDYAQKDSHSFVINAGDKQHYVHLLKALEEQHSLPNTMIHLWGISETDDVNIVQCIQYGFYSQIYLCQAFEHITTPSGITLKICMNETQCLNTNENIYPEKVLCISPSKVIPNEYSFFNCQFIDCVFQQLVDNNINNAGLIDELLNTEIQNKHIAYRRGLRWQQTYQQAPLPPVNHCPALLRQQGCYLITGGLGGLGLVFADYLAKQVQCTLILLSRSGFIEKSQWDQWLSDHGENNSISKKILSLKAIEAIGSKVVVVKADVADEVVLNKTLIAWMEKEGPINGVFHSAGISSQGAIQLKKTKDIEQALAAKIIGTRNLKKLFSNDNLDFIVLFSSQTAIFGGKGEIDYCAANLFLDAFAQQYDNPEGTRYIAINWPAWKQTGMAVDIDLPTVQRAENEEYLEKIGITSQQGCEALNRILAHPVYCQIAVGPYSVATLSNEREQVHEEKAKGLVATHYTQDIQIKCVGSKTQTEDKLAQIWAVQLGLSCINVEDKLLSLGADSLQFVTVSGEIRSQFKIKLTFEKLLKLTTIRKQAETIDQLLAEEMHIIPSIISRNRTSALTSYSQQRLWMIYQVEEQRAIYNMPYAFCLKGLLQPNALRKALETVLKRHSSLRTIFSNDENGNGIQTVQNDFIFEMPIIDLSALSKTQQSEQIAVLIDQDQTMPFNLSQDLLLRAKLIKRAEQQYVFLLNVHHIASDGISIGILVNELSLLYNAESQSKYNPLPALPIQYIDYSEWQREWFCGDRLEHDFLFWSNYLNGIPQVHNLPLDHPRPSLQSYKGDYHLQYIDNDITEKLQLLAQKNDTTLFVVMQSALATFISRYSNETDIVIGFPIANRGQKNVEPLIGFFINTLLLRSDLSKDPSFKELLAQTKENILATYTHQHTPFELLVEKLNLQRSLNYGSLFQIMLAYQHQRGDDLNFSGLQVTPVEMEGKYSKFDLSLEIQETSKGLEVLWEYSTDILEGSTIKRWASNFAVLLEGITANPHEHISKLPLLTQREQQQVVLNWNHAHIFFPCKKSIVEVFEEQVKRDPDAIALLFSDQSVTYGDLNQRANQLAHYLMEQGITPDTLVGICIERSIAMVIGLLGILKAGGAYVPLDPEYPETRLDYMLVDSGVTLLLTTTDIQRRHHFMDQNTLFLESCVFLNDYSTDNVDSKTIAIRADNLAYVIYTSGSTGNPKGVCIVHKGVTRLVCQTNYIELNRDTTVLLHSTISFDAATFELWGPLLNGGKIAIYDGENADIVAIGEAVRRHQVNILWLTSGLLPLWAEEYKFNNLGLHFLFFGGDVCSSSCVRTLYDHDPCITLLHVYGPTENTTFSTFYTVPRSVDGQTPLPMGKPIAQSSCYILDQRQQPVPIGCIGELYVGGSGLARGYLNREDLTAEKFITLSLSPSINERLYRTGDLVQWLPDGNIEFIGRRDFQVKIRGFRIELGEIEMQLSSSELIVDCIAIVREDFPGDKRIVVYLVFAHDISQEEHNFHLDMLKRELEQHLPKHMLPSAFVIMERLPLTNNGKIDRKALPQPDVNVLMQDTYMAPRTETEEILCQIWQEILNVESIGIHDDFFTLGGHSLIAIKLISKIRKQFSITLPISELFKNATVSKLAVFIATLDPAQLLPLKKVEQGKVVPTSYSQQFMWATMQKPGLENIFHLPIALMLRGRVDLVVLKQSIQAIIDRHDVLRMHIAEQGGQTYMIIDDTLLFDLAVSTADSFEDIERLFKDKRECLFDFYDGPLIKGYLWRINDEQSALIVDVHHLLCDGWSVGVFEHELNHFYNCYSQNKTPNLPPLEIQYQDVAYWQCQWHQTEKYQKQLRHWSKKVAYYSNDWLPTDTPRNAITNYRCAKKYIDISETLYQQISQFSNRKGVTPYIAFMAAFQICLYRYSTVSNIMVASPVAERERSELEHVIGMHLNQLLIECRISDSSTLEEILRQVETERNHASQNDINIYAIFEEIKQTNEHQGLFNPPQFNLLDFVHEEDWSSSNLTVEPIILEHTDIAISIELALTIQKTSQGIEADLMYINTLFKSETIAQLADDFKQALVAMIIRPDTSMAELYHMENCVTTGIT